MVRNTAYRPPAKARCKGQSRVQKWRDPIFSGKRILHKVGKSHVIVDGYTAEIRYWYPLYCDDSRVFSWFSHFDPEASITTKDPKDSSYLTMWKGTRV